MAQPRTDKAKSRKPKGGVRGAAFKSPRVQHALSALSARGVLGKGATTKVSARLDPGLLEAAREKIGAKTDTELLTAALAVVAGGDDFGAWLVSHRGRLPADFELEF